MKRLKVMLGVLIFSCFFSSMYGQGYLPGGGATVVQAQPLRVTFSKTTNLIFPYNIMDVDYGSSGIIIQQRKKAKNILLVKAATKGFEQTSLSVVTADGGFYSFIINYADDVSELNYVLGNETNTGFTNIEQNEAGLEEQASLIVGESSFLHKTTRQDFARLRLQGVFTGDNTLWLKMHLKNLSTVDFPIGYVKFFIKDKKRIKRQAVQETEIFPVYTLYKDIVEGKTSESMLIGFEPFVVPKSKRLIIQVGDNKGQRFLQMKMKPRLVLRARTI